MSEWKFGDVIRRHEDSGDHNNQAHAMVLCRADRQFGVWYRAIGLRVVVTTSGKRRGYSQGETAHNINSDYWTLVTDE